jgi:integral membrane sensor domain MASE1
MAERTRFSENSLVGSTLRNNLLWILAVAFLYFLVARISLLFIFDPEGIAAIWPPAGIFLSGIVLTRKQYRPHLIILLFLTDLLAELLAGIPFSIGIIYSFTVTGEACLSTFLLTRLLGVPVKLESVRSVIYFIILAPILSNGLFALIAAGASALLTGASYWDSWKWWVISGGIGNLLTTPLILTWADYLGKTKKKWKLGRILEGILLFLLPAILIDIALFSLPSSLEFSLLVTYLTFPFLAWAALRFQMRGVSLASLILAAVVITGTSTGNIQIFLQANVLQEIILLQSFLAIIIIPSLLLAATTSERQTSDLQRQVLLDIMQGSSLSTDLMAFLQLIHKSLGRVIYAENISITFYQKETDLFEEVYVVDQFDGPMPPSRLENSLTAYVFRSGQTLLVNASGFKKLVQQGLVELVGTTSACWLGAPLKTPAGIIGVITIQDYTNLERYTEKDKDLLTSIASQVALAIERKQAEQNLGRKISDLERVLDLTVDRELLVADLKKEVNGLLLQSGQAEKYRVAR